MRKLQSLRNAIVAVIPDLARKPENLLVFVEAGSVAAYYSSNDSHRVDYTANLVVLDFSGDIGVISATICNWLKTEQPELLLNPDRMKDSVTFEAELINHSAMDVSFKVKLEERVVVTDVVDWPEEPSMAGVAPETDVLLKTGFGNADLIAGNIDG